jgi:hypothetical protein
MEPPSLIGEMHGETRMVKGEHAADRTSLGFGVHGAAGQD